MPVLFIPINNHIFLLFYEVFMVQSATNTERGGNGGREGEGAREREREREMLSIGPADKLERNTYAMLHDKCLCIGLFQQTHQIYMCKFRACPYRDVGRKCVDFI
jgi:hypothetical protein